MAKIYRGTQGKSQYVSTNDVFDTFKKDIAAGEVLREEKRVQWKKDYENVIKEQQGIESTGSQEFNLFVGNWSGAIQEQALTLKNGLESGQISSKDYTSNWANLKSDNDQLISSQKTYKDRADKVYQDFNNGTGSLGNVQALNKYNKQLNLKGLEAVPNSQGGVDLYNTESKQIISSFSLNNLTKIDIQKFDIAKNAKALVDQFGKKITQTPGKDGKQITSIEIGGVMFELSEASAKPDSEFNRALKESAMASLLTGNNMASYLIDGPLGYSLDGDPTDSKTLNVKDDGTIDIPESAQEEAINSFVKDIRNAIGFKEAPLISEYQDRYLNYLENKGTSETVDELEFRDYRSNKNLLTNASGDLVVAKNTIRNLDNPYDKDNREDTTDTIKNIFDKGFTFPGFNRQDVKLTYNDGGEVFEPARTQQSVSGKSNLNIPPQLSVPSATVMVEKLQDESLVIPQSEGNKILDNYLYIASLRNQENKNLTLNDYIEIFDGDQELLARYNPQFKLDEKVEEGIDSASPPPFNEWKKSNPDGTISDWNRIYKS